MYKAHINDLTKEIQTVKQHSENAASLCQKFSIPELKTILYIIGLLHDLGKYQPSFVRKMDGAPIHVEHSICGALAVKGRYCQPLALLMQYCIAGHHSGLPNGGNANDTPDMPTLSGRLQRETEDYSAYKTELEIPEIDENAFMKFLVSDCANDMGRLIEKFAFLSRYCFSCLTDADSLDTAIFCGGPANRSLKANFERCLERVNQRLASFECKTTLQRTRALLQKQVFDKTNIESEIYLMNMPTGSGKTLCSLKFALERAIHSNKKRIIYIIPFNSIIDQTAETFERILENDAEILRHQSTFSYDDREDYSEDYRLTAKLAAENWDAQLIITTAVQFFESIYANKRGKLRKLHNMADSVLIFDEAHLMPQNYLQPCLTAIGYITKYLNSEAVFLTATMPDFRDLVVKYGLPNNKIADLVDDTTPFSIFQKCAYQDAGLLSDQALLQKAKQSPSSLIVVNKRATAVRLYQLCRGKKYHLSTYMTAFDRQRVIGEIKDELARLEKDYPDLCHVPEERKITVISTSLIEAGVDLDFYTVFREVSGLDSILQAGGRCNREGKRASADVFVFRLESEAGKRSVDERPGLTKGLMAEFDDISTPDCIRTYYERLFYVKSEQLSKNALSNVCSSIYSIPFRDYAEQFELIDSRTVSVVVVRDDCSRELVEQLKYTGYGNARKLQKYAFSVYLYEFNELLKQHVVEDYKSGIYCLTNPDYYSEETGVIFEARDYIL